MNRVALVGAVAIALTACGGGLAACGSRRPAPASGHRDAGDAGLVDALAVVDAAPLAGVDPAYRVVALDDAGSGHLAVTVVWPTASAALRRSPGRTACGTARAPRARIGTLHGVAGAVVVIDVTRGKAPPPAAAIRVALRDCALEPAVILAPGLGGALEVQSQDEAAHHVVATGLGPVWSSEPRDGALAAAALPAFGHTVAIALAGPGVVRLVADGAADDAAYAIAPPHPYLAITDEAGAAGFDHVPPGTYPVHAWLPPAAGQPARVATGEAVITAAGDTAVTLTFAP